jgi:uncharacterized protein YraI
MVLVCASSMAFSSMAAAQEATITGSVNVRAGPDRALPTVTWLLSGTRVKIVGCLADWRWCDVIAGSNRGWVYSRYLSQPFEGSAITVLRGGPKLGLPVIGFDLGPYWDEHYQSQRWFGRKAEWQKRWDQRAPLRSARDPAGPSQ